MIKLKNIKKQENKFIALLILIVVVFLFVVLFGIYLGGLVKKERGISQDKSKDAVLQLENEKEMETSNDEEILNDKFVSSEVLNQPKELRIGRYFLTDIKLIDNYYYAMIDTCLREDKTSNYPDYIWGTWSQLDYPDFNPEVALVRYLLFPEDNDDFKPNKACYIKEIKTDKDWQEVKEKYNFSKDRFI
jgi:hypothetical protein